MSWRQFRFDELAPAHVPARLAREARPHAMILDIGMLDRTGYEVARLIRAETWGGAVRLIAVTGWGQNEDKVRAIDAGFDHHLTKPIEADQLERLLNAFFKSGSSSPNHPVAHCE
jgi:DNA-binding response OmpR family regulator